MSLCNQKYIDPSTGKYKTDNINKCCFQLHVDESKLPKQSPICSANSYTEFGEGTQPGPLDGCCYNIDIENLKTDLNNNYQLSELQELVKRFLSKTDVTGLSKSDLIKDLTDFTSTQNPMCTHNEVFEGACTAQKFLDEIKNYPSGTPAVVTKYANSQINNSTVAQCSNLVSKLNANPLCDNTKLTKSTCTKTGVTNLLGKLTHESLSNIATVNKVSWCGTKKLSTWLIVVIAVSGVSLLALIIFLIKKSQSKMRVY